MSMPRRNFSVDPVLLVILGVAAVLLLAHLDHRPFWQDEAETACLARNVLKFGVPRAFDGVNLVAQEWGLDSGPGHLWRWSPWVQIYLAALAFYLGGLTTAAGRLPFALLGLACIGLVYLLIRRRFGDVAWARLAALFLTCSVTYLLFARQLRYYSPGAFFVVLSLFAFRGNWQNRFVPAALLVGSLAVLFYTSYLLFLSYLGPFVISALVLYREEMPWGRMVKLALVFMLLLLPGLALFPFQTQTGFLNVTLIGRSLEGYFSDLLQFMLPLPVALSLLWHWRPLLRKDTTFLEDPQERFILFLGLLIVGNIVMLMMVPQREHRYLVHLYPACAIILAWAVLKVYRYHRISGALLGVILLFTNFLHLLPLEWLKLVNRPYHNDVHMLTSPNLPLKLFVTELVRGYPDVNGNLIRFFQTRARPGDLVVATYGDLPLQFYTSCQVMGGLQNRVPEAGQLPDWVVKRTLPRRDRDMVVNKTERYIRDELDLARNYEAIVLPHADEFFGNQPDPYFHRFVPPEDFPPLMVYRKRPGMGDHAPRS